VLAITALAVVFAFVAWAWIRTRLQEGVAAAAARREIDRVSAGDELPGAPPVDPAPLAAAAESDEAEPPR
jgi:hypothetical protein